MISNIASTYAVRQLMVCPLAFTDDFPFSLAETRPREYRGNLDRNEAGEHKEHIDNYDSSLPAYMIHEAIHLTHPADECKSQPFLSLALRQADTTC